MSHYGTLRDFKFETEVEDIRGANIYGLNDEKLGRIDDVIFDHSTGELRYVVVDSGGWLTSNRFLVPAERIRTYKGDDFRIDMRRDQIERFPAYDEKLLESEEKWRDYEARYRREWTDSPVLHREGSDKAITPDTVSAEPGGGSVMSGSSADLTPQRLAGKFPEPGPGPEKTMLRPAGATVRAEDAARASIGATERRWHEFGEHVRRRRQEIVRNCVICEPTRRVA
jgi:hypothetical protein